MARIEEQIRATRPDRSVLLTASAGSGKTRALVHRIIHLLATGSPPGSIVASTFSEKAAAQMEERLYAELAAAANSGMDAAELIGLEPEDAPYPILKSPEEILSALSVRPDALRISTIHSLCLWILRRFPLEAGLPPDFSVMDEWEIPARREQAIDACMDAVYAGELAGEFDALVCCGYHYDGVRALIEAVFAKRPHLMKLAQDAGGPEGLAARVEAALDPAGKLAEADRLLSGGVPQDMARRLSAIIPEHAPVKDGYRDALATLAQAAGGEGFMPAFETLYRFFFTGSGTLQKNSPLTKAAATAVIKQDQPSQKGSARDEAAARLKVEHDSLYNELRDVSLNIAGLMDYAQGARALVALIRLFFSTEAIYSHSNRSEGFVDYDDLEICAYALLMRPDAAGLLSSIESRASHYLVDEFQDTGELQWGIIERLAAEVFSGTGIEGPGSPTIFAVGDAKQSIYRFRMASRRLMGALKDRMEETVAPERRDFPALEHNFRSAPEIVRVVNETFGALLPEEYAPSTPFRKNARGSVTFSIGRADKEADALADAMRDMLGVPVTDAVTGEQRHAGYGDMAVLLRTRTRLGEYEDALRKRGIPFKVVGGTGFFSQPEVRAVVGILNFLDDPADTLPLAAALKSPLFGLSDGELEPFFKSGEPLEALAGISPDAYRLISGWRESSGVSSPGRIVQEIISGSAAAFVFGVKYGPSALMNIEKLAALAAGFDRRATAGLAEFAAWLRDYRQSSDMPGADVELPQFSRFASIMTVHAAKGLEFPIVFIANAGHTPGNHRDRFLLATAEPDDMAVSTGALLGENPEYARLDALEKEAEADESTRLLYVAMTRAMDHLVISAGVKEAKGGGYKKPSEKSWAGMILKAGPPSLMPPGGEEPEPPCSCSFPIHGLRGSGETSYEAAVATLPGQLSADAMRTSPVKSGGRRSFISPSSLAETIVDEAAQALPYPAALRGSAIHRAIEMYGKTGACDARRACASQSGFSSLERGVAEELVADVDRTLARFLEDERARALVTPGEGKFFELPLMLRRGGDVILGSADLVVVEGAVAAVYDFKSGLTGLPDGLIASAYAPQLAAYADAAGAAFGIGDVSRHIVLVEGARFIRL